MGFALDLDQLESYGAQGSGGIAMKSGGFLWTGDGLDFKEEPMRCRLRVAALSFSLGLQVEGALV